MNPRPSVGEEPAAGLLALSESDDSAPGAALGPPDEFAAGAASGPSCGFLAGAMTASATTRALISTPASIANPGEGL